MKTRRFITMAALALLALGASAQEVNKSLQFDEKVHDFGTIEERGGKVSHRFKVTNIGKEPQTLMSATAGCSCVSGSVSKEPIRPGQSGYVTITFDPDYRPGHFSKEIVVRSGDKLYNRIWVRGDVNPGKHPVQETCRYDFGSGFFTNYEHLGFADLTPYKPSIMKLKYANNTDRLMEVKWEIRKNDPNFMVKISNFTNLEPQQIGELKVTVVAYHPWEGKAEATLTPIVDGQRLAPIDLKLYCK